MNCRVMIALTVIGTVSFAVAPSYAQNKLSLPPGEAAQFSIAARRTGRSQCQTSRG